MLRIGGGWETLADYLRRHDPCRAAEQHRQRERQTQAVEETMPSPDEPTTLANAKSAPTSAEKNTPEKGENSAQEKDANEPTEDKSMPENDEKTTKNCEATPGNDEIYKTAEQQGMNINEANENVSA